MRRTRGLIVAACLAALSLTACGGGGDSSTTSAQEPASPSTSATEEATPSPSVESEPEPEPEPVTLHDTCPQVEASLPSGAYPNARRWNEYLNALSSLRTAGDVETQNALDVLIPSVTALASNPDDSDDLDAFSAMLDAHQEMLQALGTLADRCAAVGSSALQ